MHTQYLKSQYLKSQHLKSQHLKYLAQPLVVLPGLKRSLNYLNTKFSRRFGQWLEQLMIMPIVIMTLVVVMTTQVIASPAYATGVYDLPSPTNHEWVLDQADVLSRLSKGRLNSRLDQVAETTGTEVRIVAMHRLDYGETVESLSAQLFEQWFPSSADRANQVVLLLDDLTNTSAIQVGSSAQAKLTPDVAESVAQETLLVPVRKGNYNQAFLDASDRLALVLAGKPDPGPPVIADNVQVEGTFASAEETKENQGSATVWVIGLLAAATIIPMATYYLYLYLQQSQ